MMNKNNIIVSVVIILLAIGAGAYLNRRTVDRPVTETTAGTPSEQRYDKAFSLVCDASKSMSVMFHLPEDTNVDVSLSDGRKLNLINDNDEHNARYFSADKKVALVNTGKTLELVESGTSTYTSCILAQE